MVLDGVNNPGFSGGPTFHQQYNEDNPAVDVVGMIKGFRFEKEKLGQVFTRSGPVGKSVQPERDLFVRTNSGMIYACRRRHIEELFGRLNHGLYVKQNPD